MTETQPSAVETGARTGGDETRAAAELKKSGGRVRIVRGRMRRSSWVRNEI